MTDMLPFEDEVLNGLIVNMFEECSETGEAVDGAKFYELLLPVFGEGKHGDVHDRAVVVGNRTG